MLPWWLASVAELALFVPLSVAMAWNHSCNDLHLKQAEPAFQPIFGQE
jgi:hypothetical protein